MSGRPGRSAVALLWLAAAPAAVAGGADERPAAPAPQRLTLAECVRIAAQRNPAIRSAYLDRVSQRYVLRVAEDKFRPHGTISPAVLRSSTRADAGRSRADSATLTTRVSELLPAGAELDLSLDASAEHPAGPDADSYLSSWRLALDQPLLRGGGLAVASASVRSARITEKMNVLVLRATLEQTIADAIGAYRDFLQAERQLEIARKSLDTARELLQVNQELIAAGRAAEVDIVDSEADLANREFGVLSAENSFDAARLALLRLLNMDSHTRIEPVPEEAEVKALHPDPDASLQTALENRPDYLQALDRLDLASIDARLARNNRLWDLDLLGTWGSKSTAASLGGSLQPLFDSSRSDWSLGLQLRIPLRDLSRRQALVESDVGLQQARIRLEEAKLRVETEVQDAVRNVEMRLRGVGLARHARELAERKLDVGREKLTAGRISSFQLVSYQNDLVAARSAELDAAIAYLNALTSLDLATGTTLAAWGIELDER